MLTQPMCTVITDNHKCCIEVIFDTAPNRHRNLRPGEEKYTIPRVLGKLIEKFISYPFDEDGECYRWDILSDGLHDSLTGRSIPFQAMNNPDRVDDFIISVLDLNVREIDKVFKNIETDYSTSGPEGPFDQERYNEAVKIINEEFKRIK
jgi:hypothetical protein